MLIYLYYPLLIVILLTGAKIYRKQQWNKEFLSLSQTKALQGFCAICIMLHHIAQKTCAEWLKPEFIIPGLEPFVPIGYLLVGIFLFCSGYGLYKSYKTKQDYLEDFFGKRILPLLLALVSTDFIFMYVRLRMGDELALSQPFTISGPALVNQYAWYVFALLVLYISFYLTFRYCRNEKIAIAVNGITVLFYIMFCDWWMYGGWWYNSVILFAEGLFFAYYEERIVEKIRKHYGLCIASSLLAMIVFHVMAEYTQEILGTAYHYATGRWVTLLSQMAAVSAFVILVFLLGMKVKIGNKFLAFMGSITLEFYLMHGLFVQLFGYSFVKDGIPPLYYIKNVALMVLVVFLLTLPVAYLLHRIHKRIAEFLNKRKHWLKIFQKDMKKWCMGLVAVVMILTVFSSISSRGKSKGAKELVDIYAKENITYTEVDGQRMAAYVTGEGEHTIVLLGGVEDFCPAITLKPMADVLAENNKVIILEQFGRGFSDDTDKERTTENLVYELHTALNNLGEEGPYILIPHHSAGIYAMQYASLYPQEVEALIGLDTHVPQLAEEIMTRQRMVPEEYARRMEKQGKVYYYGQRLLSFSGFVRTEWNLYETLYKYNSQSELEVLEEIFVRRYCGKVVANELKLDYDNASSVLEQKYASDLPVLLLLAHYSCEGYTYGDVEWEQMHRNMLTNTELQKVNILSGGYNFVYYNAHVVAEMVQEFIEQL